MKFTREFLISSFKKSKSKKTPSLSKNAAPAAILIPIIEEAKEFSVLFTKRTLDLKHHPGQVSFPGGRAEDIDQNLMQTALREVNEEIGLDVHQIEVIGQLDPLLSTSNFEVTPFVALIKPPLKLVIDPLEVTEVFTVPLDFLMNEANIKKEFFLYEGQEHEIFVIEHNQHRIWGMTARIIVQLRERLLRKSPSF